TSSYHSAVSPTVSPRPPVCSSMSFFLLLRPPPSTLFPYTTLFRSLPNLEAILSLGAGVDHLIGDPELPSVPIIRVVDQDLTERRSEEHTSELQSHLNVVCRLLLEKKNDAPAAARARRAQHLALRGR